MIRCSILMSVAWCMGCAGVAPAQGPLREAQERLKAAQAAKGAAEARVAELEQESRELHAQLALARAELRDLRSQDRPETVRIGTRRVTREELPWEARPAPVEEPEDREGRPVLRLYGEAFAPENLPPVPSVPDGLPDRLPTAPVPEGGAAEIVASTAPTQPAGPVGPRSIDVAVEDPAAAAYRAALTLVRERRFEQALEAFDRFLSDHPTHPYADNALFWQGELHFVQKSYRASLSAFERVVREYPRGNKAADALLKMALCRRQMGDLSAAGALIERLQRDYPDSVAARMASREDAS